MLRPKKIDRYKTKICGMIKKWFLLIPAVGILLLAYVILAGSVDKTITSEDQAAILSLGVDDTCQIKSSFDEELACILKIQSTIHTRFADTRCAKRGTEIEPNSFIQRGFGCCYDRARFTEKALEHFGYQTRHVALYRSDKFGVFSILIPRVGSHATTEVKTSQGWMGVDSNDLFILRDSNGKLYTFKEIESFKSIMPDVLKQIELFNYPLTVVYGLYSRHGMFHGANLPAPEINYSDFLFNFL